MTLATKQTLEAVERRLEEFCRQSSAGSIEIHIQGGKPKSLKVICNEVLQVVK